MARPGRCHEVSGYTLADVDDRSREAFSVDDIKCINYYRFCRFTFEKERYTCSGGES